MFHKSFKTEKMKTETLNKLDLTIIQKVQSTKYSNLLDLDFFLPREIDNCTDISMEWEHSIKRIEACIELNNDKYIENFSSDQYSLDVEFDVYNNMSYDHGDYYTAPSTYGDIKIEIDSVKLVDHYEDIEFKILDKLFIQELKNIIQSKIENS